MEKIDESQSEPFTALLALIIHGFPRPLQILITLFVLVPIMTYFIMP